MGALQQYIKEKIENIETKVKKWPIWLRFISCFISFLLAGIGPIFELIIINKLSPYFNFNQNKTLSTFIIILYFTIPSFFIILSFWFWKLGKEGLDEEKKRFYQDLVFFDPYLYKPHESIWEERKKKKERRKKRP